MKYLVSMKSFKNGLSNFSTKPYVQFYSFQISNSIWGGASIKYYLTDLSNSCIVDWKKKIVDLEVNYLVRFSLNEFLLCFK